MTPREHLSLRYRHRLRRGLIASGVGALAVAGVIVGNATGADPQVVAVTSAQTTPGSREVFLHLPSCNGEVRDVDVRESADEVVVRVAMVVGDGGEDCLDSTPIQLDRPLGRRRLVDGPTGGRALVQVDRSERYAAISRAHLSDDGRNLDLDTDLCRPRAGEVVLDDAPDRVTVAVAHHGTLARPRCESTHTVTLAEPLADRQLVDLATGNDLYPYQARPP